MLKFQPFEFHYKIFEGLCRKVLFKMDEEDAHNFVITALKNETVKDFIPNFKINFSNLNSNVFGMEFKNPIGLAAGFDKNAECMNSLAKFGFGFLEVGTVTKLPQIGNPKPRIFRLVEDKAIINFLGFNNRGSEFFSENISHLFEEVENLNCRLGINIGKNKDSNDGIKDYIDLLEKFYIFSDYITINISSPNTPGLRDMQHDSSFDELLEAISNKKQELIKTTKTTKPVLVKISPDNSLEQLELMAEKILKYKIDGVIISNTTIQDRENLNSPKKLDKGGLSGKPLFNRSTTTLREFYKLTEGKIPLIGAGGVFTAEDAYTKILNGASLVQIYTAFIYQGFSIVKQLNQDLSYLLQKNGFKNVSEAIGKGI
ncbi:MAG: quinone-dependent dihydroorotate dehydrogenase [Sphingobacteriia bacterium]|nr:quinone-dependent dihydroorotate dehydrogenase [Sphingobacteriia bacterium]